MALSLIPEDNNKAGGIVLVVTGAIMKIMQSYYPQITNETVIEIPLIAAAITPYLHDVFFLKRQP